ncbi:MAG: hypothetical protein LBJ90_04630 [Treponema sp.]|jgi:hypothetical protein|nr:hypothetical protein [Treponema sp.]
MKQIAVVFRIFLAAAVLASLAACSGGTFFDPGHLDADAGALGGLMGNSDDDWDDDDDSDSKPSKLSDNAGYSQAIAKLDEIIAYCDAHPETTNNYYAKLAAESSKAVITLTLWNSAKEQYITLINSYIDGLQ